MYGLSKTRLLKFSLALSREENLYTGKKIYIPTSSEQREIDRDISIQRERERASMNERQTDRQTYSHQCRRDREGEEKMNEYYS